ncbi:hypothetical protein Tco_0534327 [Tanacetum coccineum]
MSSPVFVNSVIISVKSGFDDIVIIDGRDYDSKINLLLICFRSKFENSLHSFPYHSKLLMYNDRDHSISCIGLVRDTMQSLALPMMFVLLVYRRTGPLITYPDDDSPDEICVILRCLNGLFALFSPQVMGVHHEDRPDLLLLCSALRLTSIMFFVKSSHNLFLLMALEHGGVYVVQIALTVIENGSQLIILEHLTQLSP